MRKAVKLELLRKNHIEFTSHRVGEEALYSFRILYAAKSIGFIDEKPVYFYLNRENSQSKIKMADPWGQVVECLKEYLIQENLYTKYADTVNAFNLTATVISLDKIDKIYHGAEKKMAAKTRIHQFHNIYDKSAGIDCVNMSYKARIFIPFLCHGIYWPILFASKLKRLL